METIQGRLSVFSRQQVLSLPKRDGNLEEGARMVLEKYEVLSLPKRDGNPETVYTAPNDTDTF